MLYLTNLQLFKNSIDTREKLRLNLHSLSVSVSELLEYGRYTWLPHSLLEGKMAVKLMRITRYM